MRQNCAESAKQFLTLDGYCDELLKLYGEVIGNG